MFGDDVGEKWNWGSGNGIEKRDTIPERRQPHQGGLEESKRLL